MYKENINERANNFGWLLDADQAIEDLTAIKEAEGLRVAEFDRELLESLINLDNK